MAVMPGATGRAVLWGGCSEARSAEGEELVRVEEGFPFLCHY